MEFNGYFTRQVVAVAAVLLAIGYFVAVLVMSLGRRDGEPTRYLPFVGSATGVFVVSSSVLLRTVSDPRPAYLLRWNAAPVWCAVVLAAALLTLAVHEARQSRWLRLAERGQTSRYRVANRSSVATNTLEPLFGHAPHPYALLLVEHEAYRRPPVVLGAVPSSAALARRSFFVSIQAIAIVLGTLGPSRRSAEHRSSWSSCVETTRESSSSSQIIGIGTPQIMGRFGPALRVTGVQHPAPALYCQVERRRSGIFATAGYAIPVSEGRNLLPDPPATEIHGLLYAQVTQIDGADRRNVLLARALCAPTSLGDTSASHDVVAIGHWDQHDVELLLAGLALPKDSPLSVLAVELLPELERKEDPLGADLGQVRILRTSPLVAVPPVCP